MFMCERERERERVVSLNNLVVRVQEGEGGEEEERDTSPPLLQADQFHPSSP